MKASGGTRTHHTSLDDKALDLQLRYSPLSFHATSDVEQNLSSFFLASFLSSIHPSNFSTAARFFSKSFRKVDLKFFGGRHLHFLPLIWIFLLTLFFPQFKINDFFLTAFDELIDVEKLLEPLKHQHSAFLRQFFCSNSLPLASTRCVRSTIKHLFAMPSFSKQCTAVNKSQQHQEIPKKNLGIAENQTGGLWVRSRSPLCYAAPLLRQIICYFGNFEVSAVFLGTPRSPIFLLLQPR